MKELLKQALDTLDHIGYQGRESKPDELAQENPWRDAIDAQLFCLHLGTADSFPSAQAHLSKLEAETAAEYAQSVVSYNVSRIDRLNKRREEYK